VPPTVLEIRSLDELTQEVFGPVMHVIRYKRAELPKVVEQINASGFGLTLGVHSRIDETIDYITSARTSATSTSTATSSAPWWAACSRSAAKANRAPARKPAVRCT
jgi:acyl-CoA reductase-like NAD-dependent aldehyde dehydrogenase